MTEDRKDVIVEKATNIMKLHTNNIPLFEGYILLIISAYKSSMNLVIFLAITKQPIILKLIHIFLLCIRFQ